MFKLIVFRTGLQSVFPNKYSKLCLGDAVHERLVFPPGLVPPGQTATAELRWFRRVDKPNTFANAAKE